MVRQFLNDDAGYIAWLVAHPDGYVINTYARVSARYLVVHRARCRSINRPLPPGRSWTYEYQKVCSADRRELEAWAHRETGSQGKPCGQCLSGESLGAVVRRPAGPPAGGISSRAPRLLNAPVEFTGEPVQIVIPRGGDDSPRLVIEGAQWLAETFFRRDPSAVGPNSYDARIVTTQWNRPLRDRVVDGDITAVNTTMAARTAHATWAPIVASPDWSWLQALIPEWDLFETPDADVPWATMANRLAAAFTVTKRPGLGLAVITKVLHIKRPRLIPVMDSVVVEQIGGSVSADVLTWVAAIGQVRAVGRANLNELRAIQDHLRAKGIADRSLVRILDALLWVSSPGSGLFSSLAGWERVVRPRQD